MSEIKISKVVIHELVKEQHEKIEESNLRDEVLDANLDSVRKLVVGVTDMYGKKNNIAHYGVFRNDQGRGRFPDAFEEYAGQRPPDNEAFMGLSLAAMTALYRSAENVQAASGGYMLFADYANAQGRYFLVAMIKQKEGLRLSRQLVPEELTQLDLSRLHQAARISYGKLSAYKSAKKEDQQEMNYLSFVSPSNNKSTAGYFVTALGCAPGTASARATDTIIKAGVGFFRNNAGLIQHRQHFKNDLMDYLSTKLDKGESVKLSEVERLARKYLPADEPGSADEIADEFISFLNNEDNAVPVEFPVNKSTLKKHRQIRYKHENWELTFERMALGEKDDAQVYYDRSQNRLILNAIPSRLVAQIQDELANNRDS